MVIARSSGPTAWMRCVELLGVAAAPALAQVVERDRVADVGVAGIEHDDVLEVGQVVLDLADLAELLGVLDEHRLGLGVLDHVVALGRGVGLVDRDRDGAGGEDRHVGEGPLGPGVADDRDLLAVLDPQVDQAAGDLADRLAELGVGGLDPLVARPCAAARACRRASAAARPARSAIVLRPVPCSGAVTASIVFLPVGSGERSRRYDALASSCRRIASFSVSSNSILSIRP